MLDTSGLNQLTALITAFLQIAVMVGILLLFVAFIYRALGGNKIRGLDVSKKFKVIGYLMPIFLFAFLSVGGSAAIGMQTANTQVFGGTVVTLECTGLTKTSEYTIYGSGNTETFTNITFVAQNTEEYIVVKVLDETDGLYSLNLDTSTAGVADGTGAVTVTFTVTDPADILPTDFFLNLIVPIVIIGVVVMIAAGFISNKKD